MSYFDDASLVMIPSGYKDQKVYSVKPIDGSGDLTFSRASNATRVNSSGLVEKVRTNNVLDSQDFTSGWTNGNVTISTSATANPVDGQLTAQDIIPNTSLSVHRILRTAGFANSINTWSIYAKAKGYDFITIVENGNTGANVSFNLSTGAVSQQNSAVGQIQSLGGGWYRCSMIVTCGNTPRFDVYVSPTDSLAAYSGDGASGVILFGAQAEQSDFGPTPYIATTSAAVSVGPVSGLPRLDYSGGASCPSLLLEPQRTNYATFNEAFSNWSPSAGTITSNATTSPDGYANADLYTEDTTTGYHRFANSCAGATGSTKTYSLYAKWAGGTGRKWLTIDNGPVSYFDLENGVKGNVGANCTTSMQAIGNGWYRCVVTNTASSVGTFYIGTASANGGAGNHLGNGQPAIYVWGAQCEDNASYATSVIPTLSSAVTRVADAASKTGISSLIGQTEGTIYVEATLTNVVDPSNIRGILEINDGTTNNRFSVYRGANDLFVYVGVIASGTSTASFTSSAITGQIKIAVGYDSSGITVYINGSLLGTDNSVTIPACSELDLGIITNNTNRILGDGINQVLLFTSRLSNADLATLTTL